MTKPAVGMEPPDPPPTLQAVNLALTTTSFALVGAGIIDLILAFVADCLNRLNLALGLAELILGLIVLLWIISWWLPRRRRSLREYEAQLDVYRQSLLDRELSPAEGGATPETGGGTGGPRV